MKYFFHLGKFTKNTIAFEVTDIAGNVIFEYEDEDISEVGFLLWQLGYMQDETDYKGLAEYLIEIGILDLGDIVVKA